MGDNKVIEIGSPTIQGAKVEAKPNKKIVKNRTVLIFKKEKKDKNSRRKKMVIDKKYSMIRINKNFFKKMVRFYLRLRRFSKPNKKRF